VGQLYVEKYFPPASKARVEEMVRNIMAAFGRRIDALEWMAPATKARAKEKLAALEVGVGYPDKWVDYSGLESCAATPSATTSGRSSSSSSATCASSAGPSTARNGS
jgi:predicted metalloendopeptidase